MKEWKFKITTKTMINANLHVSFTFLSNKYNLGEMLMEAAYSAPMWKVKVKVKFSLEQATKAQRWGRFIALLFLQPRR